MANLTYWKDKLAAYDADEWSKIPSLFAQEAAGYFPKSGSLLELGAGLGQDGRWFAEQGYDVTQTDLTEQDGMTQVDLNQPLPFEPNSFDIVYAHLSLHYYSEARTKALLDEIYTVLRPGGVVAFLVNSTHDPELTVGDEIEPNYRAIKGIEKRFFDVPFTQEVTAKFRPLLLDEKGTSYKDRAAGMTQLIRYVGVKDANTNN